MCSKRAASPMDRCDVAEPKAIKRGIIMEWRNTAEYGEVWDIRDRVWRYLQVCPMRSEIDKEQAFQRHRDMKRHDAVLNPYAFILDLRKACPSFADMPISANAIDNLNDVMAHTEVTAWICREVQAIVDEYNVCESLRKLSRNLFWASQLGLASMSHLGILMKSYQHYYWQPYIDITWDQYVIAVSEYPNPADSGILRPPMFLCPDDRIVHPRAPYFSLPRHPSDNYVPEHLPRCFFEVVSRERKLDLTQCILYAPILVELLYTTPGMTKPIIHRIASFLWRDVVLA